MSTIILTKRKYSSIIDRIHTFAKVVVENVGVIRHGTNANAGLNAIFVDRTIRIFYTFLLAARTSAVRISAVAVRAQTLVRARFVDAFGTVTTRMYFFLALVHV